MAAIDTRCCGSGTCIINEAGECWCGQKWDGNTMIPRVSHYNENTKLNEPCPIDDDIESQNEFRVD